MSTTEAPLVEPTRAAEGKTLPATGTTGATATGTTGTPRSTSGTATRPVPIASSRADSRLPTSALRAGAWHKHDAGFIDNVFGERTCVGKVKISFCAAGKCVGDECPFVGPPAIDRGFSDSGTISPTSARCSPASTTI